MTCPPCTHDCNEGRNCPNGRVPRIMVFTVVVVLAFALYGASSAGRDIVALYLRLQ